ncbi:acetyl-CoA synthetase-like protein [Pholiota conissans]|uniref:Acetyl-CoA synthetase-like protein n=1 Tax=Pholiota conissans TaxID=109636 RepID=A0A9P5Z736_9AGAR|nr:acetyl-CoA synthetase-like protein [Pholiota conissans]
MLNTHLTVLDSSSSKYASETLFRIPQVDSTGRVEVWRSVTYQRFNQDVELFARHWTRVFKAQNIPTRSVIGCWLAGFSYFDVLHIYGLSRAGYIPQLFSLRLPNPDVIYELLRKSNARAMIYDPSFETVLKDCPLPIHLAFQSERIESVEESLPSIWDSKSSDIAFYFHTSGSTSGSPKLVPMSFGWLNSVVMKSHHISMPQNPGRQDVTSCMGSMCHIGQTFMFIGTLQHGSCVIQPTVIGFSSDELVDMIVRCGLNRLNQFAAFLLKHFRTARQDPKVLSVLKNLDDVLYSGMPLPYEDEQWALKSGIRLRNLFGSTEIGGMLLSGEHEKNRALLRPIPGTSYRFDPIESGQEEGVHKSTAILYELVILADSPDCPDISLRHSADQHFHTGDLFQQVLPGWYVSRGRDDDWIKSETSLRCDTKAIEDNARAMCKELVGECIVVGSGRPSPVMFVEPADDSLDHNKLKKDIIRKTRHFHSRRYLHERITSADMIVIVPRQTLPRTATKGNIRRKAVEEAFKVEIDKIFGCSS